VILERILTIMSDFCENINFEMIRNTFGFNPQIRARKNRPRSRQRQLHKEIRMAWISAGNAGRRR